MFKRTTNVLRPHLRNLHTQAASATRAARGNAVALTVASGAVAGAVLWYKADTLHNDMIPIAPHATAIDKTHERPADTGIDPDVLYSMIWGSNEAKLLVPESSSKSPHRFPTIAHWLDNVALRDLQLGKTTGACIDARGDVYQWGQGFFGEIMENASRPKRTLRGKNIIQLQLTDEKLYALSASGKIYVVATDAFAQALPTGAPTPASDSWWGTGWLWGEDETVDFAEVTPNEHLGWRESFTSIAAGQNHLLALTSNGRVFGHPINKKANQWGQLGFRKLSIPDPASSPASKAHLHVELVPKSFTDPFAKETRSVRVGDSTFTGDLAKIDDSNIRFCPHIFEIPALKGVNIAQIAAGSRTSFARTKDGRVLGWGANEYGQIGLGATVIVDTITVPTEVVLWRLTERGTKTKCLDVTAGGDLTAFVVERKKDNTPTTTDLLMCGNGQYGGLGNNTYSAGQSVPSRIRGISGLLQYNDDRNTLVPVTPEEVSISPDGHVIMALNSSDASHGVGGRDVMVWGKNYAHELGNGKKASSAVPINLEAPNGNRLMLMSRKAKQIKDLQGQVWKKGVKVEQRALAGDGSSVVYWQIVN